MSVYIEITGGKIDYNVRLKSRYTVIVGCSALGKSFLVDLLVNPKRYPGYHSKVSDNYEVIANVEDFKLVLRDPNFTTNKYIFIVDDDAAEYDNYIQVLLKECKASCFIFMTRNDRVLGINYGLTDVYEFVKVGNS